jgi:hypothetical protein
MYMDHNHDHNYFSRRMCMDQYVRDTLPKKHFGFTLKKKKKKKKQFWKKYWVSLDFCQSVKLFLPLLRRFNPTEPVVEKSVIL